MKTAMRMRKRHGVTFGEILACISITAVVAAVLFPVFAQPHASSGRSCNSFLNDLCRALQMYAGDNDDVLPLEFYATDGDHKIDPRGNASGTKGFSLYDAHYLYVKSTVRYQCPAYHERRGKFGLNQLVQAASGGKIHRCEIQVNVIEYLYNRRLFGNQAFVSGPHHASIHGHDISNPNNTVAFYDGKFIYKNQINDLVPSSNIRYRKVQTEFDDPNLCGDPRHGDGLQVGFLDGQVRYYKKYREIPEDEHEAQKRAYHMPYDLHGIPN